MVDQDKLQDEIHDIDKRMIAIETILLRLETNHLAHIESSMEKMEARMESMDKRMWTGALAFYAQALVVTFGVIGFLASRLL